MKIEDFRKEMGLHTYVKKERTCLRCGKMFKSEWAGNRICSDHEEEDHIETYTFKEIDFVYDLSTSDIVGESACTGSLCDEFKEKGPE